MDQQVLDALQKLGPVQLDELVACFGTAGWPPVFLAVDRLSLSGRLEIAGRGVYRVLPTDPR